MTTGTKAMETPVEIDFPGTKPDPALRSVVEAHVAALEKRFGRITACRIAVAAPSGRHRTGGLYEVRIHLALPGGNTIDVDHVPNDDERFAEVSFAVNDAFKRARRRLQDRVRRMQGRVKTHNAKAAGGGGGTEP